MQKLKTWGRQILAALVLCHGGNLAFSADLVIGQVAPLSGVLASTGQQMVVGGKIYFDSINAQGGIHGAMIRQEVVDDGYKVDETVRLTRGMLAGLKNVHGLGISQVVPYPFMTSLPVVRQYQELLKKYAPNEVVNYTGGITVGYSTSNRIGSRFVEMTVISGTGKLMR